LCSDSCTAGYVSPDGQPGLIPKITVFGTEDGSVDDVIHLRGNDMKGDALRKAMMPLLCACVFVFGHVQAEETASGNDWEFSATLYL
jgi:hypothetical protein